MLAELAVSDANAFAALVKIAKDSLPADTSAPAVQAEAAPAAPKLGCQEGRRQEAAAKKAAEARLPSSRADVAAITRRSRTGCQSY